MATGFDSSTRLNGEAAIQLILPSPQMKKKRDNKLYTKVDPGDDHEGPAVWICCRTELITRESFPREIRTIEEVLFIGSLDTKDIAKKIVDLFNEGR